MIEAQVLYIKNLKMIIPKQQMKIEQTQGQDLKKQALQLIIELYMTRCKHQDISFLHSNFHSSEQIAQGVGSCLKNGLTLAGINNNRILYGQNEKVAPSKCLTFQQCIIIQLWNPFLVIGFLFLLGCIIYSQVKYQLQLGNSAKIITICQFLVSLARILQSFYYSKRLQKSSLEKTKNNMYQVIRNGHLLQIQQSQIVVGDIIQLGFKQKVPATGIVISSKPIFVKQAKNQKQMLSSGQQHQVPPQLKMNLQSSLNKIQHMNLLDLKINIQKSSLPSPIVLRGSQLLKGDTYTLLIISVSEQNLLKKYGYNKQDKFQNKGYKQWATQLAHKWRIWCLVLLVFVIIVLPITQVSEVQLDEEKNKKQVQIFVNKFLQIGVLILLLNQNIIKFYLDKIFVKLMVDIKIIEKYSAFFTVERILCNQRNVIEEDSIIVEQLAVCEKMDIVSLQQFENLNENTAKIIKKVDNIFKLNIKQGLKSFLKQKQKQKQKKVEGIQQQKINRIIHIFRKNYKIISFLCAPELTTAKKINHNIENANILKQFKQPHTNDKMRQPCSSLLVKDTIQQKQNKGSHHLLKLPKISTQFQNHNLKELIQTKARMRSINLLDGLANLAEKGLKTYYYQLYDLKGLEQVKDVIINGKIAQFTLEYKQRMGMLARKLKVVYNLTPFLVGYSEGAYNEKPFRTLICIIGIKMKSQNQLIQKLKQLEAEGIKSLIFMLASKNSSHLVDTGVFKNQAKLQKYQEQQILDQYANRQWLGKQQEDKIYSMEKLKNQMRRLVCKNCWISNCDCKDKIQQVTDIQSFIQIQDNIKIIYNIDEEGIKFLESAYKQLQNSSISINNGNISGLDVIQSVLLCISFVIKMRSSVMLFYVIVIVYFGSASVCWLTDWEYISCIQIGIQYLYITTFITAVFLMESKLKKICPNTRSQQQNHDGIKIMHSRETIVYYIVAIVIVIGTILLSRLHYTIPQYNDNFDAVIQKFQLNPYKCKYTQDNGHIVGNFIFQQCSPDFITNDQQNLYNSIEQSNSYLNPSINFIQYSRLSTFITYYLFMTLWLLIILAHRNFKSLLSIIIYLIFFFSYTLAIQLVPQLTHTYSEGLAWQQYGLILAASSFTLFVGYFIGHLLEKLPIFRYFKQQTQSIVNFEEGKRSKKDGYTGKLKKYWISKKLLMFEKSAVENTTGIFCKGKQ